ncbi:hypothetical protein M1446_04150 [Candidatus Dependentiae bacterium]|nr:hypothetical protein [Candidatus Dependentiae bacterium]
MKKINYIFFTYLIIIFGLNNIFAADLDLTTKQFYLGLAISKSLKLVPDILNLKTKVENIKDRDIPCIKDPTKTTSEKLLCAQKIISILDEVSSLIGELLAKPNSIDPKKTTPGIITELVRGFSTEENAKKLASTGLTLLDVIKVLKEINNLLGKIAEREEGTILEGSPAIEPAEKATI